MCRDEACLKYSIPEDIVTLFEKWSAEKGRSITYTDDDIELLSLIITLDEIGFTGDEIRRYLDSDEKLSLLNERRDSLLRSIHDAELQLEKLDYLRFSADKRGVRI